MLIPHLLMVSCGRGTRRKHVTRVSLYDHLSPGVLILHVLLHEGFFDCRIPGPIFPTIPVDFIVWLHGGVSFTKVHEAELTAEKTKTKRLMQRAHPPSITLAR